MNTKYNNYIIKIFLLFFILNCNKNRIEKSMSNKCLIECGYIRKIEKENDLFIPNPIKYIINTYHSAYGADKQVLYENLNFLSSTYEVVPWNENSDHRMYMIINKLKLLLHNECINILFKNRFKIPIDNDDKYYSIDFIDIISTHLDNIEILNDKNILSSNYRKAMGICIFHKEKTRRILQILNDKTLVKPNLKWIL